MDKCIFEWLTCFGSGIKGQEALKFCWNQTLKIFFVVVAVVFFKSWNWLGTYIFHSFPHQKGSHYSNITLTFSWFRQPSRYSFFSVRFLRVIFFFPSHNDIFILLVRTSSKPIPVSLMNNIFWPAWEIDALHNCVCVAEMTGPRSSSGALTQRIHNTENPQSISENIKGTVASLLCIHTHICTYIQIPGDQEDL